METGCAYGGNIVLAHLAAWAFDRSVLQPGEEHWARTVLRPLEQHHRVFSWTILRSDLCRSALQVLADRRPNLRVVRWLVVRTLSFANDDGRRFKL